MRLVYDDQVKMHVSVLKGLHKSCPTEKLKRHDGLESLTSALLIALEKLPDFRLPNDVEILVEAFSNLCFPLRHEHRRAYHQNPLQFPQSGLNLCQDNPGLDGLAS